MITIDTILDFFRESVENKKVVDAHTYVDASAKLNILLSDEHDKLFILQQNVAQAKVLLIEGGKSVAQAKAIVEASDVYREMKVQQAKIERVEEFIKIGKIMSRLKSDEMRGY